MKSGINQYNKECVYLNRPVPGTSVTGINQLNNSVESCFKILKESKYSYADILSNQIYKTTCCKEIDKNTTHTMKQTCRHFFNQQGHILHHTFSHSRNINLVKIFVKLTPTPPPPNVEMIKYDIINAVLNEILYFTLVICIITYINLQWFLTIGKYKCSITFSQPGGVNFVL